MKGDSEKPISIQTVRRLPHYYNYLKMMQEAGVERVSAPTIAKQMGLNEVQVRKDLAAVSECGGTPRTGFRVGELVWSIGRYLGYDHMRDAVLVGAGHLGSALLSYEGFREYGLRISAAFDNSEDCVGRKSFSGMIYPVESIPDYCRCQNVQIGIIAVPDSHAQEICDLLISGGVRAIWNFASVHLVAPREVLVQNENMAVSLALLSQHLTDRQRGGEGETTQARE